MASVKMNDVGTKKAMLVYALSGCKCLGCNTKLAFNEFQLDHITAQQTYIEQGKAINHLLGNLATLCRTCNASKQANGIEFYSENVQSFLHRVAKWQASASNPNDIRSILKTPFKNIDGKKIDAKVMETVCDKYAMANPTTKFARIHKNGLFAQMAIA